MKTRKQSISQTPLYPIRFDPSISIGGISVPQLLVCTDGKGQVEYDGTIYIIANCTSGID